MDSERIRRLKWLCRRGMKELDLMLERFLERERDSLRNGRWPELEALLQTEDDRLWSWLRHTDDPRAAGYRPLLERIRDGAEHLH